jgi:hypothetical protein
VGWLADAFVRPAWLVAVKAAAAIASASVNSEAQRPTLSPHLEFRRTVMSFLSTIAATLRVDD